MALSSGQIVLGLAAGGAVAFAIVQIRKRGAPVAGGTRGTTPGGASGSDCDKLAGLGYGADKICKAAAAIAGAFSKENADEADANNIAKNGPIIERNALKIENRFFELRQHKMKVETPNHDIVWKSLVKGREVPRHENGCIPTTGKASKCAEGSSGYDYFGTLNTGIPFVDDYIAYDDGSFTNWSTGYRTGDQDPLTHKHFAVVEGKTMAYPLACAAGHEPWWLGGRAVCRPPGTSIARDASTGLLQFTKTPTWPMDTSGAGRPVDTGTSTTNDSDTAARAACERTGIATGSWVKDPGASQCRRRRAGEK